MGASCGANSPVPEEQHQPLPIRSQLLSLQKVAQPRQDAPLPPANHTSGVDRQVLERYLCLEDQIRRTESSHILESLRLKQLQFTDLGKTVTTLAQHHENCVLKTAKEKKDVDDVRELSVKNFFQDQSSLDASLSKEQEEYLEARNTEEIVRKELEGVRRQRDDVSADVTVLLADAQKLEDLYEEQDDLLAGIFDGEYGSDLENSLEAELDRLLTSKQRISVADYKWSNSVVLLQHANTQLATAVSAWAQLQQCHPSDTQQRYNICTTARNHLVAAGQNIGAARQYLGTIAFPYCEPAELETLARAARNVYTDMQTADRHAHAMHVYSTTQARAAALLQWFQYVISGTIKKDLQSACDAVNLKAHRLRTERMSLIRQKISETLGKELDISSEVEFASVEAEKMVVMTTANKEPLVMHADEGDWTGVSDETAKQSEVGKQQTSPAQLPLSELAPPPKTEDIFEDIDDLRRAHERETANLDRAKLADRTRLEQGLTEKLRARRSRVQRRTAPS